MTEVKKNSPFYFVVFKEVQPLLTIAYVLAVAIGMLFNHYKYTLFGVNIFDYSSVFDFLLAPFADTAIVLFTVGSLGLTFVLFHIDKVWKERFPASYAKYTFGMDSKIKWKGFRILLIGGIGVYYLFLAANVYGKWEKEEVLAQEDMLIAFMDKSHFKGKLLGKTTDYIFAYQQGKVFVIPIQAQIKAVQLHLLQSKD